MFKTRLFLLASFIYLLYTYSDLVQINWISQKIIFIKFLKINALKHLLISAVIFNWFSTNLLLATFLTYKFFAQKLWICYLVFILIILYQKEFLSKFLTSLREKDVLVVYFGRKGILKLANKCMVSSYFSEGLPQEMCLRCIQ